MKAYSIFDDFSDDAVDILRNAGVELDVHPFGVARPSSEQMKCILEDYDCIILGTSQKISEDMFKNINTSKVIATASVGVDHIRIPLDKKSLITIINTPKANAQSVAEYTIGCALNCCKRLAEGRSAYWEGKNNKVLKKPEDLFGKTIGVIGAGNISKMIMEYARFFGMKIICWTRHPEAHKELFNNNIVYKDLAELMSMSDIISVNLPNNVETKKIISRDLIDLVKEDAIFISVSRSEVIDMEAIFEKAKACKCFYACFDIDVDEFIVERIKNLNNIYVTPHIAGGTVETRKRMFKELAVQIVGLV